MKNSKHQTQTPSPSLTLNGLLLNGIRPSDDEKPNNSQRRYARHVLLAVTSNLIRFHDCVES